jgi:hypothetical protein
MEMEISVNNHADALIIHTAICGAGSTNSSYRRAESEIQLAIPSAFIMPAEWRFL